MPRCPVEPTPEEDGAPCLICTELFSKSKSREQWIQCNPCPCWAHKLCSSYDGIGFYV